MRTRTTYASHAKTPSIKKVSEPKMPSLFQTMFGIHNHILLHLLFMQKNKDPITDNEKKTPPRS